MQSPVADHIVTTALSVFYRNGFHASGVDLLSQEAGVTKKTLYRHYPSKELLIEAALEWRHREFMQRMNAFVERAAIEDRPLAYMDYLAAWVQEDDFNGCAFINASAEYGYSSDAPHRQAAAHKAAIRQALRAWCTRAGAKAPAAIADALFVLGEGLVVSTQVQGVEAALLEATRRAASGLWAGARRG